MAVGKGNGKHDGQKEAAALAQKPLLLTVPEAARLLHLGRNSAYELVARRQLPAVRFGRAIRIPRAALEAWLERAALDSVDRDGTPWLSLKPCLPYEH